MPFPRSQESRHLAVFTFTIKQLPCSFCTHRNVADLLFPHSQINSRLAISTLAGIRPPCRFFTHRKLVTLPFRQSQEHGRHTILGFTGKQPPNCFCTHRNTAALPFSTLTRNCLSCHSCSYRITTLRTVSRTSHGGHGTGQPFTLVDPGTVVLLSPWRESVKLVELTDAALWLY